MEAEKEEIIVKEEKGMKSKCGHICHTNLLDYVLLIGGSSPSRELSLAKHTYLLYLRNFQCSPSSAVGIKVDLSSRKKIRQLWLGSTCFECAGIRDKLKDMVYSLVAKLDGPSTWASDLMLRELSKSSHRFCRLFLARIFADDWKKHLVFVMDSPCYSRLLPLSNLGLKYKDSLYGGPDSNLLHHAVDSQQVEDVKLDTSNGACNGKCHSVPAKIGKGLTPIKRKRGKEKKVSVEDIYSYLSRNFTINAAAEGLGVSRSTLKRKCRQFGIAQWPPSKGKKRSRRTSKGDQVPKLDPGLEVAGLKSVSSTKDVATQYIIGSCGTLTTKKLPRFSFGYEAASHKGKHVGNSASGFTAASPKSINSSVEDLKSGSNINPKGKNIAEYGSSRRRSVSQYRHIDQNLSDQRTLLLLPCKYCEEDQPKPLIHAWNRTKSIHLGTNLSTGAMMHGRLAYSHEKNSLSSFLSGQISGVLSPLMQQDGTLEGMTWLIKATYNGDMVRFRYFFKPNIAELKKEVAQRLNLKLGAFKVKYLDDENEWALLTSSLDWQEFIYNLRSSRQIVVRLLVQDRQMEEEDMDDLQATLLKL